MSEKGCKSYTNPSKTKEQIGETRYGSKAECELDLEGKQDASENCKCSKGAQNTATKASVGKA